MLPMLRSLLLVGGTVTVVGLAAVGAGAIAAPDRAAAPTTEDVASAADALLAADTTPTASAPARLTAQQLRRLAAWRHLVHAQATLDIPALGGLTTVQLDHGTTASVSATSLTIQESGGGSVTVALDGQTKVRRNGAAGAAGDLQPGDEVFAMSRVETDGAAAYLVVVPRR